MAKERILITVRTYPTISKRYVETVCTGGITENGDWRRLYPVPLRYMEQSQRFKTFDIVEVEVRPGDDGRPESRKPNMATLKIVDHLDIWTSRNDWIKPTIGESIAAIQLAGRTLAPVVAREILEFTAEPVDTEWSASQKELLRQDLMFDERKPLEKIPFDFRIRWRDGAEVEHDSLVLAWEIYQTWRQYGKKYDDPVEHMRKKWLTDILSPKRDVSFFMGNHSRFRENWMVCGWFNPPKEITKDATLF